MKHILQQWLRKFVKSSATGIVAVALVVAVSAMPNTQSASSDPAGNSASTLVNWNAGGG